MSIHDPKAVRREYGTEAGLLARRAAYANATGPDAPAMVFDAVAEARPRRFLEVGCGPGELVAQVQDELGAECVAIDISERMVELTRERGVDARIGDVQDLPFPDASFDCVVAAWMLYHVPDIDRALDELVRVLRPGGRLVAVTNHRDHLQELRELVGAPAPAFHFAGEDGEALLRARFGAVEVRDAAGTATFADAAAVEAYVRASAALFGEGIEVPPLTEPLIVRRRPVIFVATR